MTDITVISQAEIQRTVVSTGGQQGIQGPQGAVGPKGDKGDPGEAELGGYAAQISNPQPSDLVQFAASPQAWVNSNLLDGGNF